MTPISRLDMITDIQKWNGFWTKRKAISRSLWKTRGFRSIRHCWPSKAMSSVVCLAMASKSRQRRKHLSREPLMRRSRLSFVSYIWKKLFSLMTKTVNWCPMFVSWPTSIRSWDTSINSANITWIVCRLKTWNVCMRSLSCTRSLSWLMSSMNGLLIILGNGSLMIHWYWTEWTWQLMVKSWSMWPKISPNYIVLRVKLNVSINVT